MKSCPECVAGKHQNCNGQAWDDERDEVGVCPCLTSGHPDNADPDVLASL